MTGFRNRSYNFKMGAGRKKKRKTALKAALFLSFFVLPLLVGAAAGGYLAISKGVPSIAELKLYRSYPGTAVYSDDDTLIAELKPRGGIFVPLKKISPDVINAVIAVEDSHFWEHRGIDYLAILRAAAKDVLHGQLKEGGSTITQQLAKMTFLTPEKTIERKLKEAVLATRIEKNLSKEEIIELYLNEAYFGHGAYGVETASRVYFGKSVIQLTLPESALLAGLLKAPSKYSPFRNFKKARERQEVALRRMESENFITERQRLEALRAPVYFSRERGAEKADNYFIEYVKKYLLEKYGEEVVYKGGLRVYTTLSRQMQASASHALQSGLRELDKRQGWRGPLERGGGGPSAEKEGGGFRGLPPSAGDIVSAVVLKVGEKEAYLNASGVAGKLSLKDAEWAAKQLDPKTGRFKRTENFNLKHILLPGDVVRVKVKSMEKAPVELALEQEPEVQGALVSVEPNSGYIKALVGGYDFTKSEFNRALYAKRQPGSAFKPVIYALALDAGFTPASIIIDDEIQYRSGPGGLWVPKNFDNKYHGPTRLRDALTYSRNVVTVKLVERMGVGKVIEYANNLGISSEMPRDLTIALGSLSITPLDLTSAYLVFASGGVKRKPVAVKYITDRKGRIVESTEAEGVRVIEPQSAYLITSMMKDVIQHGTARRVKALGRPAAGKTGTTNEYRDAWFMGYTTDLVAGVWVGFDELKSLGSEETGSRAAAPIWLEFMQAASTGEQRDFDVPEGIVERLIDPESGLLAGDIASHAMVEYFRAGTEPKKYAPSIWKVDRYENMIFNE